MRNFWACLFGFLALMGFNPIQASTIGDSLNYRVNRSDYTFSSVFEMANNKKPIGSVVKSMFHLRTHYDSYDRFGAYEGQGICRLFCLGSFYVWGTEIDIYNVNGEKVGIIDGQAMSSESAKFSFYNAMGNRVAIAYLDQNSQGFSLVDPENPAFILARMQRNYILDSIDNWDVYIYSHQIPLELMKIFAAFVCDVQNKFKADL